MGQLLTGRLADTIGRRPLIVTGMIVQAATFPAVLLLLAWPLVAGPDVRLRAACGPVDHQRLVARWLGRAGGG